MELKKRILKRVAKTLLASVVCVVHNLKQYSACKKCSLDAGDSIDIKNVRSDASIGLYTRKSDFFDLKKINPMIENEG